MIHVPKHVTNDHLKDDIRKRTGRSVVILKKESFLAKHKRKHPKIYHHSKRFIATMVIASFVVYVSRVHFLRAEAVTFYPKACLGGFESSKLAEGKPDTSVDAGQDDFHKDNAAFLSHEKNADLYCGNFDGEVAENTTPKKIELTVHMALKSPQKETVIHMDASTSLFEVLDAKGDVKAVQGDEKKSDSSATKENTTQTPEVKSAPTQETETKSSTPTDEHASLKWNSFISFIETAHAEEESAPVVPSAPSEAPASDTSGASLSNTDTTASATATSPEGTTQTAAEVSPTQGESTKNENATSGNDGLLKTQVKDASEVNASSSSFESIVTSLFSSHESVSVVATTTVNPEYEVLYSTGNDEWNPIAFLSKENVKNFSVVMPYTANAWKDIETMQIQVKSIETLSDKDDLYVDGMELVISYETAPRESDERSYSIDHIDNNSQKLVLSLHGEKGERKLLDMKSSENAGLAIYNIETGGLLMTTALSDATSTFDPNGTIPDYGSYGAVLTEDANWCSDKSLEQCLTLSTFESLSFFSIVAQPDKEEGKSLLAKKETLSRSAGHELATTTENVETKVVASTTSTLDPKPETVDTLKSVNE